MAITEELKAAVADLQRRLVEAKIEWVMAYDDGVVMTLAAGASNTAMVVWGAQYTARGIAGIDKQ